MNQQTNEETWKVSGLNLNSCVSTGSQFTRIYENHWTNRIPMPVDPVHINSEYLESELRRVCPWEFMSWGENVLSSNWNGYVFFFCKQSCELSMIQHVLYLKIAISPHCGILILFQLSYINQLRPEIYWQGSCLFWDSGHKVTFFMMIFVRLEVSNNRFQLVASCPSNGSSPKEGLVGHLFVVSAESSICTGCVSCYQQPSTIFHHMIFFIANTRVKQWRQIILHRSAQQSALGILCLEANYLKFAGYSELAKLRIPLATGGKTLPWKRNVDEPRPAGSSGWEARRNPKTKHLWWGPWISKVKHNWSFAKWLTKIKPCIKPMSTVRKGSTRLKIGQLCIWRKQLAATATLFVTTEWVANASRPKQNEPGFCCCGSRRAEGGSTQCPKSETAVQDLFGSSTWTLETTTYFFQLYNHFLLTKVLNHFFQLT